MKTNELSGAALDWAVAKCEFDGCEDWDGTLSGVDAVSDMQGGTFNPSTNWALGGAIIEREEIELTRGTEDSSGWTATIDLYEGDVMRETQQGATPLIAAMRCYVTSKLGKQIELPEALNGQV